ncbi:hypothetical protein OQA88_3744 [Cercophora sp. LCS_1]
MSAPKTLGCLLRPSIPAARFVGVSPWIAPFSTTAANSKKVDKVPVSTHRAKRLNMGKFKKKKFERTGKSPLPGERKAHRKRIQLSNSNALPVPGLQELRPESMLDPASVGKVLSLPGELQDQLRTVEAFKPTQNWGLFRTASTLVRQDTVNLITEMQAAASKQQALRAVLTGDKLTGKSLLQLQALSHAFQNEWIVINLPDAQELTTACTEYAPIPETNPVQYMQNNYCLKLLQNIRQANEKVLARLQASSSHLDLPQQITSGTTLLALTNSAKEPEGAWLVFQALWKELTAKNAVRPPILFALDGLAHIMKMSDYRSPSYELIHSQDLALVRLFCDALSGVVPLPHGGAVIAATSRSNAPRVPSMELLLKQRLAAQKGEDIPQRDPYLKEYDARSEEMLKTVAVKDIKGLTKLEARSLMEYWAASGLFRAKCDEKTVTEKWTLGGHGVVGEMERASLLTMRP